MNSWRQILSWEVVSPEPVPGMKVRVREDLSGDDLRRIGLYGFGLRGRRYTILRIERTSTWSEYSDDYLGIGAIYIDCGYGFPLQNWEKYLEIVE